MIPDYLKFIRFQDNRAAPFFYLVVLIVLGFFWKNNAFTLNRQDALLVSVILSMTLFNLIYELKALYAYNCVIGRFNLTHFDNQQVSKGVTLLARPAVVCLLSLVVFWLLVEACLLIPSARYRVAGLFIFAPLYMFLVFRALRPVYIRQVLTSVPSGVRYKNLYHYVGAWVLLTLLVNLLSVSPLKESAAFSLAEGFASPRLMVAMLILCLIVLAINLLFVRLSKRYVFLGRIFLTEIDFFFSKSVPFKTLHDMAFVIRILFVAVVQMAWIIFISVLLALVDLRPAFEIYVLLCIIPATSYYALHLYWRWHNDFLASCDMFFRYQAFKDRIQR